MFRLSLYYPYTLNFEYRFARKKRRSPVLLGHQGFLR